jgi:hypothetical protein
LSVISRLRLSTKFTLVAILSSLSCACVIVALALDASWQAAMRQEEAQLQGSLRVAWHVLHERGADVHRDGGGRLLAGATVLDGNTDIVDGVHDIAGVTRAVNETGEAARKVLDSAGSVSQQAAGLTGQMQSFVRDIRAA